MKTKTIDLKLENTYSRITGNEYGNNIYRTQIKKYFDGNTKIIVKFPDFIQGVSISFIQGLIREPIYEYGKDKVMALLDFYSSDSFLNDRLEKNKRF